jgi:hypothetical protein
MMNLGCSNEKDEGVDLELLEIGSLLMLANVKGFAGEQDFGETILGIGKILFENSMSSTFDSLVNAMEIRALQTIAIPTDILGVDGRHDIVTHDENLGRRLRIRLGDLMLVTDVLVTNGQFGEDGFAADVIINDYLLVRYSGGDVSVPSSEVVKWGANWVQDFFALDVDRPKQISIAIEPQLRELLLSS